MSGQSPPHRPANPTPMDITPSPMQSISHPGQQLTYVCKSSSSRLSLLDMPDVILGRIIAFVGCRTLYSKSTDLPLALLPASEVCKRMRSVVSSICFSLTFEPYMPWNQFCAWLRLASPGLRVIEFHPAYSDDEEEQPEEPDLLPPSDVFSMISFHAPKIEVLDLSGVHVLTANHGNSLKDLLTMVRHTLTALALRDVGANIRPMAIASVTNARLYRLASFQIIELRSGCGRELEMMLGSFQGNGAACEPNGSALRRVHIDVNPYGRDFFVDNKFLNTLCPSVVELHFASQSSCQLPVPYDFIRCFPGLSTLTLHHIKIDPDAFCEMLSRRKALQELRILHCCVLETRSAVPNQPSRELLQVLEASAKVLTVLWMPFRTFRATELEMITYLAPPLKELGLVLAPGAASAYRSLCMRVSNKLTKVGIFGPATDEIQRYSAEEQQNIVLGLGSLPLLSNIQSIYLALSTASWEKILEQAGCGLTDFSVEVNFEDCALEQFLTLIAIISQAAIHNMNLVTFSVDSDKRPQLPSSSELGASLVRAVAILRDAATLLRTGELNVILDLWLKDFHREALDD